jgi:two-component system, chemotaxis family, sensor kinase CheA
MDLDQLQQTLMATFLEEVDEHVRSFNRDLLALEKKEDATAETRTARLNTLFRTAHNFKGAARTVGMEAMESACHALEDVLAAARGGQRPVDAALLQTCFTIVDALQDAGQRLRGGRPLSGGPLLMLLPRLDGASRGEALRLAGRAPAEKPREQPRPPDPDAPPASPPAPPPSARAAPASAHSADEQTLVRVRARVLDRSLTRSGELLVLARRSEGLRAGVEALLAVLRDVPGLRGTRVVEGMEHLLAAAERDERTLLLAVGHLDGGLRRLRMVPFAEAAEGLERAVRDVAQAGGKEVDFRVEGGAVELDRAVAEKLRDPLLHLARNAVDHGLESPAEREAAQKPRRGALVVSAAVRGSEVEVVVADDGRGLDAARIREKAQSTGLPVPEDDARLFDMVFLPGFSTARKVSSVSGRGVGLDVVREQVAALHGAVSLSSERGKGTKVTLRVPLTLSVLRALLVNAGGHTVALPSAHVRRLRRVAPGDVLSVKGREMVAVAGQTAPVPLASLAETLGSAARPMGEGLTPAVEMEAGGMRVVFLADEVLSEQELLVKGLGRRLRRVRNVAGCALLPDGSLALILNAGDLVAHVLGHASPRRLRAATRAARRVLLADDSVTTRVLLRHVLEEAGHQVTAVADGGQAWQLLQEGGFDLLVSDVEMPGMDGLALAAAVRGHPVLRKLPVVLVTALGSDEDRARGLEAGADAYVVKGGFDQRPLLEAVGQLL